MDKLRKSGGMMLKSWGLLSRQASGFLSTANNNKLLLGVCMLLMNIGSRFIVLDLSKSQEDMLKGKIFRRLVLFSLFFMATRDVLMAFLMTAAFVVLSGGLFNEESGMCIVPSLRKKRSGQEDGFHRVTEAEFHEANKVRDLYVKQHKLEEAEERRAAASAASAAAKAAN